MSSNSSRKDKLALKENTRLPDNIRRVMEHKSVTLDVAIKVVRNWTSDEMKVLSRSKTDESEIL